MSQKTILLATNVISRNVILCAILLLNKKWHSDTTCRNVGNLLTDFMLPRPSKLYYWQQMLFPVKSPHLHPVLELGKPGAVCQLPPLSGTFPLNAAVSTHPADWQSNAPISDRAAYRSWQPTLTVCLSRLLTFYRWCWFGSHFTVRQN